MSELIDQATKIIKECTLNNEWSFTEYQAIDALELLEKATKVLRHIRGMCKYRATQDRFYGKSSHGLEFILKMIEEGIDE